VYLRVGVGSILQQCTEDGTIPTVRSHLQTMLVSLLVGLLVSDMAVWNVRLLVWDVAVWNVRLLVRNMAVWNVGLLVWRRGSMECKHASSPEQLWFQRCPAC